MKRFLVSSIGNGVQSHLNKNNSSETTIVVESESRNGVPDNNIGDILSNANKMIFGNKSFRNMQEDIISAVMDAKTDVCKFKREL